MGYFHATESMHKLLATATLAAAFAVAPVWADTQIILINADGPGEGLNDPTARSPVPGNPGNTVGEQRRNALLFAANLLASRIISSVPIRVEVDFNPQFCDQSSATLATAGSNELFQFDDRPPPPGARTDVFYPAALANALAGEDLSPSLADIGAEFSSALDDIAGANTDCLDEADWYYGLDHDPPPGDFNFVSTAAHELIHGLGFASSVALLTGTFQGDERPVPDVYSYFILDQDAGRTWPQMTPAQRAESAINDPWVVWAGEFATSQGAPTLASGTRSGRIRLYAPDPLEPGSSISHWAEDVSPDDLMEPRPPSRADVDIRDGIGLTSCVLRDIGWNLANGVRCPDTSGPAIVPGRARMVGNREIPDPLSVGIIDSGDGGGCTLAAGGAPDPLWLLLLLAAVCGPRRRRA